MFRRDSFHRSYWRYITERSASDWVKICEVGPRDGLQAQKQCMTTSQRVKLVQMLTDANIPCIEVGSFVSPKWVPQMARSGEVYREVVAYNVDRKSHQATQYPVLVPNRLGWSDALTSGVKEIAIFMGASETFNMKNVNCSIGESIARFTPIVKEAKEKGIWVRAYVSCVLGCPYEGHVSHQQVVSVIQRITQDLVIDELSLGDTIGVGTPGQMKNLLRQLRKSIDIPLNQVAVHCHDTYGQALANIWVALEEGVRIVDASIGGLGGCPYAPGASGNVATEDVIYMLHKSGMQTGVSESHLAAACDYAMAQLDMRETFSKITRVRKTRQKDNKEQDSGSVSP